MRFVNTKTSTINAGYVFLLFRSIYVARYQVVPIIIIKGTDTVAHLPISLETEVKHQT